MKKENYLAIAMVIAAICYCAVLFLAAPAYTAVFFITLGFSVLCLILIAAANLNLILKPGVESYSYGLPTLYRSWAYLAVQAVAGMILACTMKSVTAALIIEFVILGIFGALLFLSAFSGAQSQSTAEKHHASVSNMRAISEEARALMTSVAADQEWYQETRTLYELIAYANPVSTEISVDLENAIHMELGKARQAAQAKDKEAFSEAKNAINEILTTRKTVR